MQNELPFYDCPEDALKACVQALGGAKKVAPEIWKAKDVDTGAKKLLDALNPARDEKLDYDETMRIFALAAAKGFHGPYQWWSAHIGYSATPLCPKVEKDRLVSVIETCAATMSDAMKMLDRIREAEGR